MIPLSYEPITDTMFVQIRDVPLDGGEDVSVDLTVHMGTDGLPAAYEIDHVTQHPEHVAFVLRELRAQQLDLEA